MTKFVYDFAEGDRDQRDLLGGKGANLAEMTNLGLPVPPGFIITTDACRAYLAEGREPESMAAEVTEHLTALEKTMGKQLGQADDPLLVSRPLRGQVLHARDDGDRPQRRPERRVRRGLATQAGDDRFAWDSYRRLVQMFGATVLGIDAEHFEDALEAAKTAKDTKNDLDLDAGDLSTLVETFKGIVSEHTGRDFPQDPREQLDLAVRAVFDSWNSPRANIYRRQERIPADLGTAVTSARWSSATSGWTRAPAWPSPATRRRASAGSTATTCRTRRARTSSPASATPLPLADLERIDKSSLRRAHGHHDHARAALPRPLRHRVHHRARQALDAADPRGQADRGRRVHHRRAAHRRGPDRRRRGPAPRHRAPARAADVPAVRPRRREGAPHHRHERLPRRGRREGGLRLARPRSPGRSAARRSSWCAARPIPTTSAA